MEVLAIIIGFALLLAGIRHSAIQVLGDLDRWWVRRQFDKNAAALNKALRT